MNGGDFLAPSDPTISVVVCTFNRKDMIVNCIQSLLRQGYEKKEIIVVDDASTDGTYEILKAYNSIRVIRHDTEKGSSHSKNEGVKEASGKIIAFTDDDCIVSENWLEEISHAIRGCDMVGGPVRPLLNGPVPPWWDDGLFWVIGVSPKLSIRIQHQNSPNYPFGSNMAIRKDILEKMQGFNEKLSRFNGGLLGTEDVELCDKMSKLGHTIKLNSRMVVYHSVPRHRLTFRYVLRRARAEGVSNFIRGETFTNNLKWLSINLLLFFITRKMSKFAACVAYASYFYSSFGFKRQNSKSRARSLKDHQRKNARYVSA